MHGYGNALGSTRATVTLRTIEETIWVFFFWPTAELACGDGGGGERGGVYIAVMMMVMALVVFYGDDDDDDDLCL